MTAWPNRLRPLLGGVLLALTSACGADDPAGPGEGGSKPQPLSIASANVQTLEIVSVGVRGVSIPGATVSGELDAQMIAGARVDDTTIALVIPPVSAGAHELHFTIGGQIFATTLQVSASPSVANPDAYLDQLVGSLTTEADAIDQRLAAATAATPASDTAGMAALSEKLRWAADSAHKIVSGMSASDRAAAAAYLQVNYGSAPTGAAEMLVGRAMVRPGCDGGTTAECNAELRAKWDALKVKIATCTVRAAKFAAVGAVALGGLGSVLGGIGALPGAALGAVLGSVGGTAICVYEINRDATETIITPAITHLEQAIPAESRAAFNTLPGTVHYRVKTSKTVDVIGQVRSLIAADVSLPGEVGAVARTVAECSTLWTTLLSKSGLSLPGPKLPQVPAFTTTRSMPASMLKIASISLAGVTATTAGGDTAFSVTFANDKQGADHPLSYAVRYEPAGLPAEEIVLQGVLRPETYIVAGLQIDSAPPEMRVGQGTAKLYFTARDSTGTFVGATGTDSLLNGRVPEWTSSKPTVASVSASGVVTAHDTGTVSITARLEEGSATVTFVVYPNVIGSWSLQTLNGEAVPFSVDDSTGTSKYLGGSITINADGTFSFSYGETYTNKFTAIEYDEGASGSGTYTLTGNAITFTILQKSGESVEELVGAGFSQGKLSLTYRGPDGSAVGVLTKG